jgi:chaperonin cofactor prefoldin
MREKEGVNDDLQQQTEHLKNLIKNNNSQIGEMHEQLKNTANLVNKATKPK